MRKVSDRVARAVRVARRSSDGDKAPLIVFGILPQSIALLTLVLSILSVLTVSSLSLGSLALPFVASLLANTTALGSSLKVRRGGNCQRGIIRKTTQQSEGHNAPLTPGEGHRERGMGEGRGAGVPALAGH